MQEVIGRNHLFSSVTEKVVICAIAAFAVVLLAFSLTSVAHAQGSAQEAEADGSAELQAVGALGLQAENVESSESTQLGVQSSRAVKQGTYELRTLLGGNMTANISGASTESGASAVLKPRTSEAALSMSQRFYIRSESKGRYSIQDVYSGQYLTVGAKGRVVQRPWQGSTKQLWTVDKLSGFVFTSVSNGKRLAVEGGKAKKDARLITTDATKSKAQQWKLSPTKLLSGGYYAIRNKMGTYLDIEAGQYCDFANVQVWARNGSGAQCFKLYGSGSAYKILNMQSFKAVEVAYAKTSEGANVSQYEENDTAAQEWKLSIRRTGGFAITNVNSGKVLSLKSASSGNGVNVVQKKDAGERSQTWTFKPAKRYSLSGNTTLDQYVAEILSECTTLRKAFDYVSEYDDRSGKTYSSGSKYLPDWVTIKFAKELVSKESGNSYRFASLFAWLARGLGYDANVCRGWIEGDDGDEVPHSWVEVYYNGTRVCDPYMEMDDPDEDWYMRKYEYAPLDYHFW